MAEEPSHEEQSDRVDAVSVLFVVGGIPAIVGFIALLFTLGVKGCGIPA